MAPTPEDDDSADEGQVLAPEELDITQQDSVASLEEGRFVIAPEGKDLNRDAVAAGERASEPEPADEPDEPEPNAEPTTLDTATVKSWLAEDVRAVDSRYGFHVTATTEGAVGHQQMFSDDVSTVFDGLLMWYAQQLDRETPVEDVLGILLLESNVRIRFPVRAFTTLLETHDLGPEDSISDLFDAIYDGEGVLFPPEGPAARTDD